MSLRLDPTLEATYNRAWELILRAFPSLSKRTCRVLVGDKLFFVDRWKDVLRKLGVTGEGLERAARIKAKHSVGLFDPTERMIVIREGREEDVQVMVHEALHSITPLHCRVAPAWICEGIPEFLTQETLKTAGIAYRSRYHMEYRAFWRGIAAEKGINRVLEAYTADGLKEASQRISKLLGVRDALKLSFKGIKEG